MPNPTAPPPTVDAPIFCQASLTAEFPTIPAPRPQLALSLLLPRG